MNRWSSGLAVVAALGVPATASAGQGPADALPDLQGSMPEPAGTDDAIRGPVLPRRWSVVTPTYWVIGPALENASQRLDERRTIKDVLVGLSTSFRYQWAAPHARILITPNRKEYQNTRVFGDHGFRAYLVHALGTELSYGVGAHFDARLEQHYWLAGVTPIELGATVYRQGSWRVELFAGARLALAGRLVDSFLVDPNGFNNENALDDLRDARDERPWEGFISIVFGRRID